jgi:hypothetical protein
MSDHVAEHIVDFDVRFSRPAWWSAKVERDSQSTTYLYWDEYTGSLRITPWRAQAPSFRLDEFLARRFEDAREHGPEWRLTNGRKAVCYVEETTSNTRLHYHVTGHADVIVVCSFAYSLALLEDEYTADEVGDALEEFDRVLETLTLAS